MQTNNKKVTKELLLPVINYINNKNFNDALKLLTQFQKQRFEEDIQRGDNPPWYLVPERYEARHGRQWAYYDLPYGAGRCKVSWETGQFNFEWS